MIVPFATEPFATGPANNPTWWAPHWRNPWAIRYRWSWYSGGTGPTVRTTDGQDVPLLPDALVEIAMNHVMRESWDALVRNFDGTRNIRRARHWQDIARPWVMSWQGAFSSLGVSRSDTTFTNMASAEVDAAIAILDSVAAQIIAAG